MKKDIMQNNGGDFVKKIENIEKEIENVNFLANEVSKRANKDISIAKHKITCLICLVALLCILGASVSIYSIHSIKELFYDMQIEENVETVDVNSDNGGKAIGIMGNDNEVNN